MPDLSGSATTLRTDGYQYRLYLSIPGETEVWRGTVTGTVAEPTLTLSFTTVSGLTTDVKPDMEAEVFDSGGTSKGRVRVAYGAISGSTINIEEVSRGRILIVAGDEIAVYESWRLRPKLVAASATFDKDSRIAYSNQNAVVKPVAVSGGAWAGFVSDGGSTVDVSYDGSASYTADSDSGGTFTYLWNFGSGSVQSGSTSSATATVRYSAGKEWNSLTITDSSNSATEVQYFPVCVHERNGANAPMDVLECSLYGTSEFGWEAQFTLAENASVTDIPDGSLVIIWAEEWYGGTKASYGANETGRSHIKFIGYIVSDTLQGEEDNNSIYPTVRFRALSPLALLAQLPGFSQVLERAASPASWIEFKDLTVKQAMIYLLRWGTTFLTTHDLLFNITDLDYPAFYLQQNVPERQFRELADAIDSALSCDRYGRLRVHRHLVLDTSANRTSRTTTFILTSDDYFGRPRMQREHRFAYSQLEASGFSAATSVTTIAPYLSVAPGVAPADAPQLTTAERKIVSNQDDLNNRTGWLFAKENYLYNGVPVLRDIELDVYPGLDVFDFREEWIKLTLPTTSNAREISLTDQRCWLDRVSIEYDCGRGDKAVALTLQQETIGAAGTTQVVAVPEIANIEIPDIETDLPWIVLPQPINPLPDWLTENPVWTDPTQIFVVGGAAGEAALITYDWATDTESAVAFGGSMTGLSIHARGDPYNSVDKYVTTEDGFWLLEDITSAPAGALVATPTDMFGTTATPGLFSGSINRRGYFIVMATASSTGTNANSGAFTTDYGATWTTFNLEGGAASFATTTCYIGSSVAVSPWNNPNAAGQGWVYGMYHTGAALKVVRSTDWGATWSELFTISSLAAHHRFCHIYIPYKRANGVPNRNDANQLFYLVAHGAEVLTNDAFMGAYYADGTDLWHQDLYGGASGVSLRTHTPWNTHDQNGAYMYAMAGGTGSRNVLVSEDAGSDMYSVDANWAADGAYAIATACDGVSSWWYGFNGWGAEGVFVHYSWGLRDHTGAAQTNTSTWLWNAYNDKGYSDPAGMLRVIRRNVDADWRVVLTGLTDERTAYAEFQLP